MCVQNFNDSRGLAIRITYRISLRSSSLWEPRHPLLKVVLGLNVDKHQAVSATNTSRHHSSVSIRQIRDLDSMYHYRLVLRWNDVKPFRILSYSPRHAQIKPPQFLAYLREEGAFLSPFIGTLNHTRDEKESKSFSWREAVDKQQQKIFFGARR